MVHADLSSELLCTIFAPRTALHDGAVIIRDDRILAAAALLPLTEMSAVRAVRHPPPGGARDHRGHRRRRRRRVRGERPDERRRAGADRARALRGAARAGPDRAARGAGRSARPRPAPQPRAPRPRPRSLPHPHDAGPRGDTGPRRRLPGSGGAAPRPRDRRHGPDAGGHRTSPADGARASRRSTDQGPVDAAARTQAKPDAPIADRTARHGRGRRTPMSLGSRVSQAVSVRRPQLAAEARGHRARDAAVRGPRRLPGQQRVPGSGGRAPPSTSPTGTVVTNDLRDIDADPVHRAARRRPAARRGLRGDRRPRQRQARRPAGQSVRVAVNAVDPRVTILDFQPRSIQVVLDEVTTKQVPVDVQQGPTPDGVDVGEMVVHADRGLGHGRDHGREPRRGRAGSSPRSTPRASTSTVTSRRGRSTTAGEIVAGVELDPRTVHVTIPLFTNRESRTLPVNPVVTGTPAQGFRIASVAVGPARRVRRGRRRPAGRADVGRHRAGVGLGRHARRRPPGPAGPAVRRDRGRARRRCT